LSSPNCALRDFEHIRKLFAGVHEQTEEAYSMVTMKLKIIERG
jgi:hypothetical protein